MKIQWKITLLFAAAFLALSALTTMSVSFLLRSKTRKEVEVFRAEQLATAKNDLKNFVEIAYTLVQEDIERAKAGSLTEEEAKARALDRLGKLRYDNGVGYFWVNDTALPYPRMVMHPTAPALNDKVMDDPKYNCAMGKKQNLFQAFVESTAKDGTGFVDYLWPKPGKDGLSSEQPKLSYVKRTSEWGWILGTGVYIDDIDAAVARKQTEAAATSGRLTSSILVINAVLFLAVLVGIRFFCARTIVSPIQRVVTLMQDISGGNLSRTVTTTSADEVGVIARSADSMTKKLNAIFKSTGNNAETLTITSADLLEISTKLSAGLARMAERHHGIASAAEEMRANMLSVSTAMEQSSGNIDSVARSIGNMEQSIGNVSRETDKARQVTIEAARQASKTSEMLSRLDTAAEEITAITGTIAEISEKTNLLALNATIEAARAGDAGKGFAVVAGEIKELANKVASSTQEIRTKVARVQSSTTATVGEIQTIVRTMENIRDIVSSTAAEMETQKTAAGGIARDIGQTAAGVNEITRNISQSTFANRNVAEDLARITETSKEINHSGLALKGLAEDVNSIAQSLAAVVHQFDLGAQRFDIAAIKRAHLSWKKNLASVLSGQKTIRPEEVSLHTQCDFGKWYFGPGQVLAGMTLFQEIGMHHEHVHAYAREIVELYNQGKTEAAQARLTDFEAARKQLFHYLDELYIS